MPTVKLAFALLFALSACGDDPHDTSPDASTPPMPDAPPVAGDCSGGGDRFVLSGAVTADSSSLGPITVDGKVAGFAGAIGGNGRLFTFTKRRTPLDGDFESVGVHDISTEQVKFLEMQLNADCSTAAGGCTGFFALAGKVTVSSIAPRFVATFELTDLYARTDSSNNMGQAMAGTVTGCVDSRLDP